MDRKDFLKLAVAATALGGCTRESPSQSSTPDSQPAPSQTPEDFAKRVFEDVAASFRGALLFIGDRLNIFEAMHGGGALTAQDLAAQARIRRGPRTHQVHKTQMPRVATRPVILTTH